LERVIETHGASLDRFAGQLAQLGRHHMLHAADWNTRWTEDFTPLLLQYLPDNYAIWHDYWKLAKEEIGEAQREN
ncbi:hypothetical protein PMAYCL1PPCAC_03646, partial [Pristionchus mayeri]